MASSQTMSGVAKRPIHRTPLAVAYACSIGTLLTDLTYWQTAEMMWADFSAWLLFAGLVMGALAVIAALVDWLTGRLSRADRPAWPYLLGSLVMLVLSFFNALVHSRDAWTSVVPTGLALSVAAVIVLLLASLTGWRSGRSRVGVVE